MLSMSPGVFRCIALSAVFFFVASFIGSFIAYPGGASAALEPTQPKMTPQEIGNGLAQVESHIAQFSVRDSDFNFLQQLIQIRPNDAFPHFLLGRCFERSGMIDMAVEHLDLAKKLETNPEETLNRLRHHIEAGELSEAFIMKNLAWEKSPNDPTIQLLHAMYMQEHGDAGNAANLYRAMLLKKNAPLGTSTALSTIHFEHGDYQGALNLAQADLERNPDYVSAQQIKAKSLLKLGKPQSCVDAIKDTLLRHPFNRKLNLIMYEALCKLGRFEDALPCALRNLAGSDFIGYYTDAKERVKKLLKILPQKTAYKIIDTVTQEVDRTHYAMKFHFYMAQVFFELRRGNEARAQIDTALKISPEFEPNWYESGRIKETFFHDYKGAIADYQEAIKLQPMDFTNLQPYRRLLRRLKKSDSDLALKLKMLSPSR